MIEAALPFIAYALALGIAALIPGPGVVALVGHALGAGAISSLPFILGLAVGDMFFLTLAVLGLSALAATASGVFFVVKVLGGLYLLYLAWRLWTSHSGPTEVSAMPSRNPWGVAASGLAVTLGNPKTVIFYMALLPNVIDLTAVSMVDWVLLCAVKLIVLLAALMPYAFLAAGPRNVFLQPKAPARLNRGAALVIGGAGAWVLRDAVTTQVR